MDELRNAAANGLNGTEMWKRISEIEARRNVSLNARFSKIDRGIGHTRPREGLALEIKELGF